MYFGVGVAASLVLSYAGSFGYTRLEDLQAIDMDKIIAGWLNNFHAISVRDINSFSIVQHLIGKEPSLNLDPVLIYNFDAAGLVPAINEKDYILIYGYDNRLTEEQYVAPIKAFAKKHNKKIISAGFFQDWCDKMVEVSPFELLAYVKQADYVICETFHGTVFSIKYQKQFAVVIRESNRNKLMDLMNRFSLGCRVFTGTEDLETILTASYDRNAVQKIIETERQNTKWYFESHLSGREFKE